jgi:hypothetical protein
LADDIARMLQIMRVIEASWPMPVTITPEDADLKRPGEIPQFLLAIQELSDSGWLTYEALVVNTTSARLCDAQLTARGREQLARLLGPRLDLKPGPPTAN